MQILTVGQSDRDKDAGETAAGGGAQPSGQDLRATMQRKGEPRGGPAGTKAQSQVLFSRNIASLCLFQSFPGCGGGAVLESYEKFGARAPDETKSREVWTGVACQQPNLSLAPMRARFTRRFLFPFTL